MIQDEMRVIHKKTFVKRFRELTGKETVNEISKRLGVEIRTVQNWRSETNTTMPDLNTIITICSEYGCNTDHLLLENHQDFTFEHSQISEITGLSSKSIEVLKRIKNTSGKTQTGMAFGSGKDNHAWKHIAMINYILEDMYDNHYLGSKYQGDEPILSVMYDYLNTEYIQYIHSMDDVNQSFGIVRDGSDLDQVLFYDQQTHLQYALTDPVKLFRRTLMDSIHDWLTDHARKKDHH